MELKARLIILITTKKTRVLYITSLGALLIKVEGGLKTATSYALARKRYEMKPQRYDKIQRCRLDGNS
jgi:hypothetical protein